MRYAFFSYVFLLLVNDEYKLKHCNFHSCEYSDDYLYSL